MRIVFMGTPEAAVPSLRRLLDDGHEVIVVWTQPDKPAGRGNKLHESPVKTFALQHGLAIHQPARIKNQEAKELFASHNADVAVVVAYGKILPSEFLQAPLSGCINLHFSLLPKYRGAAPVNWAIVHGEEKTGVTTMKIVEELDAGPKLQLNEQATFAPILKREDGLIDWSMDAFAIERRVRGFQPWPNAYTTLNSRRLIIWQAAPERAQQASGSSSSSPGQILQAQGDNLSVACGDNTVLRVLEVQLESSRRMSARDLLNGSHLTTGTVFG